MRNVTIRTAIVTDAGEIARIHVDSWRVAYADIVPERCLEQLSTEERKERWARNLSRSTDGTRVAVADDGQTVGWCSFGPSRNEQSDGVGELYAIYLDRSHWRRGVGTQLLEDALSALRESGFASVTLWVLEEKQRAIAFYEKAGFTNDGVTKVLEIEGKELIEIRYRASMSDRVR